MSFVFKRYYTITMGMLLIFSSCVKVLVPENNGYVPKPVIWAVLNPDSTISVFSSGNKGISDDDLVNINSIDMFWYENGIEVDQLFFQTIKTESQEHKFKIKPKYNNVYSLKIGNQNTEITATVIIPNPLLKPDNINLTQGENARLTYTLTDDENFIDAYQFTVEMYHFGALIDTTTNDTIDKLHSFKRNYERYEEPELNYNFLGLNNVEENVYTFPVSDKLFNGKKKSFLFTLQNIATNVFYLPRTNVQGPAIFDKLVCAQQYVLIKCRKISPEYYQFLVTENKNNAIFGTPYFNPSNVYSNVKGGLGLIAAAVERTDTVWIKK